jgi:hypothetical protein
MHSLYDDGKWGHELFVGMRCRKKPLFLKVEVAAEREQKLCFVCGLSQVMLMWARSKCY